jgi:hypothetical protein
MTNRRSRIFDDLRHDIGRLLEGPVGRRSLAQWALREPVLVDLEPAALLARVDGRVGHQRLAALLRLAADEPLAAQAALAMVAPGLAAAGSRLARAWGADSEEVDQALVAAAWERVRELAGRTVEWPAITIVVGARGRVRAGFVTESRRRRLAVGLGPAGPAPGPDDQIIGHRLLAEAAARRVISAESAGLVWATRVLGYRLAELAGPGQTESTLRVKRWQAERALRAVA